MPAPGRATEWAHGIDRGPARHVARRGVALDDLLALGDRDSAHELLPHRFPALPSRQVIPIRSGIPFGEVGQQCKAADRRGGLLRLLAADVRLSLRLASVIVVAGDVDGPVRIELPPGLRDRHQIAGVECDNCRHAGQLVQRSGSGIAFRDQHWPRLMHVTDDEVAALYSAVRYEHLRAGRIDKLQAGHPAVRVSDGNQQPAGDANFTVNAIAILHSDGLSVGSLPQTVGLHALVGEVGMRLDGRGGRPDGVHLLGCALILLFPLKRAFVPLLRGFRGHAGTVLRAERRNLRRSPSNSP